ncbi:hypothetical protein CASFOL_016625 [Castilleja foliolosa]|uniref:Uncharacterized protein n=1 Tax=Castilleja foliolosa TaxID=1961234 RepID=A0ABD3D9B3_9LAMI
MPQCTTHLTNMSFPPNLGITNSLIIESDYCILFQDFPFTLPTLNHISSPFSKNKMINNNGYSRLSIDKKSRSKSVDFSHVTSLHDHKPRSITPANLMLENREFNELNTALKIHDSIPEHEIEQEEAGKRSFSIRRSASVCEGYSRTDHNKCGLSLADQEDDDQYRIGFISVEKKRVRKKGKLFGAFKRIFGL